MGTLNANLVAPSQVASGSLETTSMAAALTAPAAVVASTLINGDGLVGAVIDYSAETSGTLVTGCVLSGAVSAPSPAVSSVLAYSVRVTAPAARAAGQLLVGSVLTGAVSSAGATAEGVATGDNVATGAVHSPKQIVISSLLSGGLLSGAASARAATGKGWLGVGRLLSAALSAPSATATGVLVAGRVLSGAVKQAAPAVIAELLNELTETYEAWLLNTESGGVSTYSNYGFHSLVAFGGRYYGVRDDGIYLLEGDDDNGDSIAAELKFGVTDLEAESLTRLGTVTLDLRASGSLAMHVTIDGEAETYSYEVVPFKAGVHPVPVPTGRSLMSLNWQIAFTNVSGADFDLNAITFQPHAVNRQA